MTHTNDLLRLLEIRHPIIQAPMAGTATPRLAASVSNAGALGSIGAGTSSTEQALTMIRATRELTDKPVNVNVFCHAPAEANPPLEQAWLNHLKPMFEEFGAEPPAEIVERHQSFLADRSMLQMLLAERPAVVSFHFGLPPAEWIRALRDAGVKTFACATTLEEAQMAQQAGVDALIAQGVEAGGHRGVFDPAKDTRMGLFALVSQIIEHTRLPVIAAGGIMNGQGIRAAMRLGAAAAQLGTAFILCPESAAQDAHRQALGSERAGRTEITSSVSGRPARGMVNRLFTDVGRADAPPVPDYPIAYDAAKALNRAAKKLGSDDFAPQWAGQGAPLARALPAGELVELLVREMNVR